MLLSINASAIRTSLASPGERTVIRGLAVPTNQVSTDRGSMAELVRPGAFLKCLRDQPDQKIVHNFDSGKVWGRTISHTAALWESPAGLEFECFPPPGVVWSDDQLVSIRRGDVDSAGALYVPVVAHLETRGGETVRIVEQADLYMVSITAFRKFASSNLKQQNESAAAATRASDKQFLKQMGIQSALPHSGRVHF